MFILKIVAWLLLFLITIFIIAPAIFASLFTVFWIIKHDDDDGG